VKYLKFALPESSKNSLIQMANLLKKGFEKWDSLPATTRNIAAGVSIMVSGIILPKALFLLSLSSYFTGRHMYLSGEVKEAAEEIIVETPTPQDPKSMDEDFGHP
jgi:hypothetical protein